MITAAVGLVCLLVGVVIGALMTLGAIENREDEGFKACQSCHFREHCATLGKCQNPANRMI